MNLAPGSDRVGLSSHLSLFTSSLLRGKNIIVKLEIFFQGDKEQGLNIEPPSSLSRWAFIEVNEQKIKFL